MKFYKIEFCASRERLQCILGHLINLNIINSFTHLDLLRFFD